MGSSTARNHPYLMRSSTRAFVLGAAALVFLFTTLLVYYREVWRPAFRGSYSKSATRLDSQNAWLVVASSEPEDAVNSGALETKGDSRPSIPTQAVVMARLPTEDTSWVQAELPSWTPYIYSVNDTSAPLHTSRNKGRESLAYLTYVVENYDNLSDTIAFLHSHKDGYPIAWHTDNQAYSNVVALDTLKIPYVQAEGYVNLRCNAEVGCDPPELQMSRQPKDPSRSVESAMPDAWRSLMGEDVPLPDIIAVACCAQFAVSKAQVRKRSLADYERYIRWVLDTDLPDDVSGRVMEYFWHVMFGRESVFCPSVSTCYCNVYGRCG